MKLINSGNNIRKALVLVLLFFAAMNFQAKFFYFVFIALILLTVMQKKLLVTKTAALYLLLGLLMAVYNSREGIMSMLRCVAYVAFYIVGFNMLAVQEGEDPGLRSAQKTGFSVLVAISSGSFLHYFLNFITNIGDTVSRNTIDVWSNEVMAATGQAMLACLMLGLAVALIFLPSKKVYRLIGIACILVVLTYNFVLAGRALILMLVALFLVGMLYFRKAAQGVFEKFRFWFGVMVVVLIIAAAFAANIGGIRNMILESNLFDRMNVLEFFWSDSERASAKLNFLADAWKYPFGGLHMSAQYGYAHDLLLDAYDEYGFLSLILLLCILVDGIVKMYRLMRQTDYSRESKMAFLCVYCAVLIAFTVEPIFAGMSWLFVCYALINGCVEGMLLYPREGEIA